MTSKYQAFLSYARLDDENDDGRISDIKKLLAKEVATQLGEPSFSIFQDIEDIAIGMRWQQVLDDNLDGTAMLIGFMSPRFFKRPACRSELERFLAKEQQTGRQDLFIPVQYLAIPEAIWGSDPLAEAVRQRQMFFLDDLRFTDLNDMTVRARISELATAIVEALHRTTLQSADSSLIAPDSCDDEDDAPGLVELLAAMEDAMPFLSESIIAVGEELAEIGDTMRRETALLNETDGGGTGRQKLVSAIRIAEGLKAPVDRIEQAVDIYTEELERVDVGIGALFAAVKSREQGDADRQDAIEAIAGSGWESITGIPANIDQFREFRETLQPLMQQSSTLRKPLRRLDAAVRCIEESAAVWRSWIERRADLIDSTS